MLSNFTKYVLTNLKMQKQNFCNCVFKNTVA